MNQNMKSYLCMELSAVRLFTLQWQHEKYI